MGLFSSLLQQGLQSIDSGLSSIGRELTAQDATHDYTDCFSDASVLLNKKNTGFSPDGHNYLPAKAANFLCVGSSGVGKSTIISAMTAFRRKESLIITDPSGELYELLAFILIRAGYKIKVINWSNPDISCGYNSLGRIKSVNEIHTLAHQIVSFTLGSGTGEKFWLFESVSIIGFVAELLYYNDEPEYFNWINVRHVIELIMINDPSVHVLVDKVSMPHLTQKYRSILAQDQKLRANTLSSALSCLTIFGSDPNIQRICSYDTLDFSDMRSELTAVFIQSDVLQSNYYSLLNSMLIKDIISSLMQNLPLPTDKYKCLFLLDEFSSLYINDIDVIISNCRKYSISLGILIQSYSQLYGRYQEQTAKTIINNCAARMYFHSQTDAVTLHNLQEELGRYSYTIDGKTMTRELKTMSEIRKMDAGNAILLYTNFDPIMLHLKPYYEQPMVVHELRKSAPMPANELPIEIPLIGRI